jgi:predicted HD superfamily hydrolase involved in NAD metabolism
VTGEVERADEMLRASGLSPELEEHSRGVAATAARLAERWGAPPEDAAVAGLLHDLAKETPGEELLTQARSLGIEVGPLEERYPAQLLHAPVAAARAAAAGFSEPAVRAIARHTVAGGGMTTLDRCVFAADAIEPGRRWRGVEEMRHLADDSLDAAVAAIVHRDVERLRRDGRQVHPMMLEQAEESGG